MIGRTGQGMGVDRVQAQRGGSLIGLLVAVLIIAVAAAFYFGRSAKTPEPTRPGGPTTRLGQSMEEGKEVDCANNLGQIRKAIAMQLMDDQDNPTPPANLDALKREGINQSMLRCPVTQQPYQYNPQGPQGPQVWCPTPGHERF